MLEMLHLTRVVILSFVYIVSGTTSTSSNSEKQLRCDYKYYESVNGWLKVHRVPMVWDQARIKCKMEGGNLASPISTNFLRALKDVVPYEVLSFGIFTGVHASFHEGAYHSIEGVPLHKMPIVWAPSEPDNFQNNERCLALVNDSMADVTCDRPLPFMCYIPHTTDNKMGICGTTDQEYKLYPETGKCYKLHKLRKPWKRAYSVCVAEGAHLAIVNSDTEALLIKNLAKSDVALGYLEWPIGEEYYTIHGETLSEAGYARWSPGQPDNFKSVQHCGGMFSNGFLDDINCLQRYSFVCEREPSIGDCADDK